jgi:hypothetical protein
LVAATLENFSLGFVITTFETSCVAASLPVVDSSPSWRIMSSSPSHSAMKSSIPVRRPLREPSVTVSPDVVVIVCSSTHRRATSRISATRCRQLAAVGGAFDMNMLLG